VDFEAFSAALRAACEATGQVDGLVLLGSTSTAGAARRDAWSDHDVYVVLADGAADELRSSLAFLPYPERVVARARESQLGFAVLYDDGHLLEFAAGTRAELAVVRSGTYELAIGRPDVEALVRESALPRPDDDLVSAADHVTLALIKLMVGVGRVRRGEAVNGGQFVHGYAISHLCRAARARLAPDATSVDTDLDPVRRIERDLPGFGTRLAAALDLPTEPAAQAVFDLIRQTLEPGWPAFPSATADAIARRLGWT
jgi:hypothetical protein